MNNKIFFILMLLANVAFAQKDFVVKLNGDTLYGTFNQAVIGFHKFKGANNEVIKIKAGALKEYYISAENKNYLSFEDINMFGPVFLERKVKGKINLYEYVVVTYNGYGSTRSVTWYISKNGSKLKVIKHNSLMTFSKEKRKDEFYDLIKDNEKVASRFLNGEDFSIKTIVDLLNQYNFDASH